MAVLAWALVYSALACGHFTQHHCKPIPGSPDWPHVDAWSALNKSVNGHLVQTVPLGAVCHQAWSVFNNASCAVVASQWSNTTFTSLNPTAADYNDETCLPNPNAPCTSDGYPVYSIVARNANDVQEGVRFAARTGIRLVIKGTGHDFPGRSSGPDSLSIYTHNLRGIDISHGDPRAKALGGDAAVKISAGEQFAHIYRVASGNNLTVLGGAHPSVGIAGWTSGGGHGPLTAKYGLGADQVLEMEVVTADGQLRTINAECQADLFWALRGGGAGTFAVLVSVTVKAYPSVAASALVFSYNTTADSEAFWGLAAYFHTQLPHLAESGLSGYYYVIPRGANSTQGNISGLWVAPERSLDEVREIVAPMERHIQSTRWNGTPAFGGSVLLPPIQNFLASWPKISTAEGAGISGRLGSRLLTNSSLLGDFDRLKHTLRTAAGSPSVTTLGHLVGPAPNTKSPTGGIAGGGNAVLPAWRRTYSHLVLPSTWTPLNQTQKTHATTELRDVRVQALRDLEPDSGAYMSEADPTEPHWQEAKFGCHYERLLQIKERWDPRGVFWCKQCVGSELWEARGDFGVENGVGQNKVRLCTRRRG